MVSVCFMEGRDEGEEVWKRRMVVIHICNQRPGVDVV